MRENEALQAEVERLQQAENKAWRESERWKDHAVELRAGISWARGMCSDGAPHERIDHFLGCVLTGNAELPPAS